MIKMTGFDQDYVLIDEQTGTAVAMGAEYGLSGITYKIEGGRAPHKPGSTGRVWVRRASEKAFVGITQHEWFPNVLDLKWVPATDYKE